jgi:RNA polymerase sigma-32 factor
VRQIEVRAFEKVQEAVKKNLTQIESTSSAGAEASV